jgi:hypothetical protein
MKQKEKCIACGSCGMPLQTAQDHAMGDETSDICCYCVKPDGTMKSYEEILQGTVDHFIAWQGITKEAAMTTARELLDKLPYWNTRVKNMMKCTPLSVSIEAPFDVAFSFISNPENIPLYSGFVRRMYKEGTIWMGETSEGVLVHRIIADRSLGVFDVFVAETEDFELPVCSRLIPNGSRCEYITAVVHPPMIDDNTYQEWVEKTRQELVKLKGLIEKSLIK